MANSLNVRIINNVTNISQGDNASTVVIELLDKDNLIMPFLDGKQALLNFIDNKGTIKQQISTSVFDSRVEFNMETGVPFGSYTVEVIINIDDATYIFPSSGSTRIKVNKSSNDYYNTVIEKDGIEVVTNAVYQKLESEISGLLGHVARKDNPHEVTKEQIGLDKVENVEQATKEEFDNHTDDSEIHITQDEREDWNAKATQNDIDEAVDNLEFVNDGDFTAHVEDNDRHWRENERTDIANAIAQAEADAKEHADDELEILEGKLNAHKDNDSVHLSVEQANKIENMLEIENDIDIVSIDENLEMTVKKIKRLGNFVFVDIKLVVLGTIPKYKTVLKINGITEGVTIDDGFFVDKFEVLEGKVERIVMLSTNQVVMFGEDLNQYDEVYINATLFLKDE